VCGLHGGAGASTLAYLLAVSASRSSTAPVLLCEAPGASGDQAALTGASSRLGLLDLAGAVAAGRAPRRFWAQQNDLRVLAGPPRRPPERDAAGDPGALLERARAAHGLTVLDVGEIRAPYAAELLAAATHIVWAAVLRDGAPAHAARIFDSDLIPPLAARQLVAVRGGRGRDQLSGTVRALRKLAPEHTDRLLLIPDTPALAGASPDLDVTVDQARQTLTALARFLSAP